MPDEARMNEPTKVEAIVETAAYVDDLDVAEVFYRECWVWR
ncbi:hypothetical protein [Tautonia marina]|nr:hypothetical protein [Tautonia marina]